jgi:hypothetical protein
LPRGSAGGAYDLGILLSGQAGTGEEAELKPVPVLADGPDNRLVKIVNEAKKLATPEK